MPAAKGSARTSLGPIIFCILSVVILFPYRTVCTTSKSTFRIPLEPYRSSTYLHITCSISSHNASLNWPYLGAATTKFQDIKLYAQTKAPHVLGIIEADVYSPLSTINRVNKYTTAIKGTINCWIKYVGSGKVTRLKSCIVVNASRAIPPSWKVENETLVTVTYCYTQ